MILEELVQIPILHIFHYHTVGFLPGTHTQDPDNVWILQLRHYLDFFAEIISENREVLLLFTLVTIAVDKIVIKSSTE